MKKIFSMVVLLATILFADEVKAQFWTETFSNGCASDCQLPYIGPNGSWTFTDNSPAFDACGFATEPNTWYVSGAECGNAAGTCGSVCGAADPSLHLSAVTIGDQGAAYDAGGWCAAGLGGFGSGTATDKRAESPLIDCTGKTTITLSFNYIERGQNTLDDASLWYNDGSTWTQIDPIAKTVNTGCFGQGRWTAFSIVLPATADNNPNVRIGFRWVNNDDGAGNDPSFAVDDITLSTPVTSNTITTGLISGSPFCAGSAINIPFTSTGVFTAGNIYTAQLSDASGSFAAPTILGTLNSIANLGTIAGTILGSTPSGNGYRVRVISSNPSTIGSDNGVNIVINAPVTPAFNAIAPVCQNATGISLPISSTNSPAITGSWSPAFSTATLGTTIYTFTPTAGQCATTTTLSITIIPPVTPTFNAVAPVCQNATAPVLPTSSTNSPAITGTWSPAVSTATVGTTIYTFTPAAGQCASTATLSITVNANVAPTFTAISNVCQNATAPVLPTSSTNSPAITGTWSPAVSTATAGTTIYTFTPTAGQCATNATLSITVDANVTPTFAAIPDVCQNATAPVLPTSSTNSPAITGSWSPAVSTATVGTTTYTFTPTAGQCATTATLSIAVTAPVTPTFVAIGPLCINSSAPTLPLSSTNSPAITGTWSPAVINTASAGITTYTFTPGVGQCATTTTMDIVITNSITPTFTAMGPFCIGSTAPALPLSSTNSPAIIGSWSPATINTASAGTTTYTFAPNAGQCAGNATMDIVITNSITPTFTAIATLCQGETPPALPSVSNNLPAIAGIWSPATVSTAVVGTTTYTFTPNAGQCAANTTMDIIVNAPNIVPNFTTMGPFCINSIAPSLPLTSVNSITGTWIPANINTSTTGITTYTFTPDAGQCATITTLDIDVTNSITPTFAAIGPLCLNSTAPALPVSSNNSPSITGTWNPTVISTTSVGFTTYNFTPDPGQCGANATLTIETTSSITPTFVTIGPLCQNTTAPLLPITSTNNPSMTGTWNPSTINTSNVGTVTYTFTPDPGQCGINTTMDIIIDATPVVPTISITGTPTTICSGDVVSFAATTSTSNVGDSIQWYVNGIAILGGTGSLFSSNSLINNSQVTAQFFPLLSPCSTILSATSNTIIITVNPSVTPTISINTTTTQLCEGIDATFNASITGGGTLPGIQWFVNGNAISGATTLSFTTNSLSNNAVVTAQLTSNAPCASPTVVTSNAMSVEVFPFGTPTISIIADKTTVCAGQSIVFSATVAFQGSNPQYNWVVNNNIIQTNSPTFIFTPTANVTVSCTLISNYLCASIDSVTSGSIEINVNPAPTCDAGDLVTIIEGSTTTLSGVANGNNINYTWTPSTTLSCSNCLNPIASPIETTTYLLYINDSITGCSSSDTVTVRVNKAYDIWVPSAFSPGDGNSINDVFYVRGNNIDSFTLKIFDRWGKKVFETSNMSLGWDGKSNDKDLNTGIYVYTLEYSLKDGSSNSQNGNITLSR